MWQKEEIYFYLCIFLLSYAFLIFTYIYSAVEFRNNSFGTVQYEFFNLGILRFINHLTSVLHTHIKNADVNEMIDPEIQAAYIRTAYHN